jgi:hypothetical protein
MMLSMQARVLDETIVEGRKVEVSVADESKFPSRHLVESERDRGPFYGLPDRVRELYKASCSI